MAAVSNFFLSNFPITNGRTPNAGSTATIQTTTTTPTVTFTNGSAIIGGTFNTTSVTKDAQVRLSTTGTLPAPWSTSTTYYVVSINSTQMQLSTVRDGTAVTTGIGGGGVHTATIVQYSQVWMIFTPTVSITCTKAAFYSTASTGLNGTDTLRASIQTVATSTRGFAEGPRPSGTLVGTAGTLVSNLLISGGWNEITGLSATLTAGTTYALVLEPTAAWTATHTVNVAVNDTGTNTPITIPGWIGGYLRETNVSGFPTLVYGSNSAYYGLPTPNGQIPTNKTITNTAAGSTYCAIGVQFRTPASIVSCKIDQITIQSLRFAWGTSPAVFRIMDSAGTTSLQATSRESALVLTTQIHGQLTIMFDGTLATLNGNTTYMFVIEYQGADLQTYTYDFDGVYAGAVDSTFGGIVGGKLYYRPDLSSAWNVSVTAIQFAPITARLSDITMSGSAGGGLIVHPGMRGGING
jgi:hypothetical protein